MILLRFLILVFNVAVVAFLIYYTVETYRKPMERSKKTLIIVGSIFLLLAPLGIFFRFFLPAPQYLVIYPVAIGLFIYFTRQL
ncbi:MAG TPA: hypothetical protein VGK59_23730 [Ohtaekwangia sp.]